MLELSRVHSGRQNFCTVEVSGTRGAIAFDYERQNELQVSTAESLGGGFTRVIVGPAQDGGLVWNLGGLGIGFAETIIVHVREMMEAVYSSSEASPSFVDGLRAQEVVDAALTSAESGEWESVTPVGDATNDRVCIPGALSARHGLFDRPRDCGVAFCSSADNPDAKSTLTGPDSVGRPG